MKAFENEIKPWKEENNMSENNEITRSEHAALVFRMNRKEAAKVARYLKEHSSSPEAIFAVDIDSKELILQARTASEDDIIILDGEDDVFDVEEEVIEEEEEVLVPEEEETEETEAAEETEK